MNSGEKQALEQSDVAQETRFRAPGSVEEAYERGWRWHVESFADLTMFESTVESVTRREGLAHFNGPEGELVIPFVATYAFGEPRVPKYPYAGGSVCLIDDDEEHAAALEREASRGIRKKEADKEKLWTVKQLLRGRVIFTYTSPAPTTEQDAIDAFSDAFCDELLLQVREVKPKTPSARTRTKKAKTRR